MESVARPCANLWWWCVSGSCARHPRECPHAAVLRHRSQRTHHNVQKQYLNVFCEIWHGSEEYSCAKLLLDIVTSSQVTSASHSSLLLRRTRPNAFSFTGLNVSPTRKVGAVTSEHSGGERLALNQVHSPPGNVAMLRNTVNVRARDI
jgi:hypothetical protein